MPARRLLPCVLGAALLTACGDTTDTTDTTEPLIDAPSTTLTTPPTQALELGEFDPEGDFQVFDPCTEIPAEVLDAAGLGESVGEPFYDGNRSAMCSFTAVDESRYPGVFSLVGDRNPRSRLEEQGLIIEGVDVEIPYGMYLHTLPGDLEKDCSVAFHTSRGRVVVMYTETLSTQTRQHFCNASLSVMDVINTYLGENNGNPDRS